MFEYGGRMVTDQKVRLAGLVRLHSSRSFSQIGATRSSSSDMGMKRAGEGPRTYHSGAYAPPRIALEPALGILLAPTKPLYD